MAIIIVIAYDKTHVL